MPFGGIAAKFLSKAVKKKAKPKRKTSPSNALERRVRAENKGDARTEGRIKRLKEQEKAGLISPRERQQALNKMTKSHKEMKAKQKTGKKVSGVRQTAPKYSKKKTARKK